MRCLKISLLCVLLQFALISPIAAAPTASGYLINFADTIVPAGTTVHSVIVIGSNVYIAGNVEDEVFVLNGNATLAPTANVRDRVIVFGGQIRAEEGAYVGKGFYRIAANFVMPFSMLGFGFFILLLWFVEITITCGLLLLPVILAWGWQKKVEDLADIIQVRTNKTILLGFLGGIAVFVASSILVITIVGIPLAVILLLSVLVVSVLGLTGVCCALGRGLPFKTPFSERRSIIYTSYGAVMLALVFNVPIIGLFALIVSLIAALGSIIIKLSTRNRGNERKGAD